MTAATAYTHRFYLYLDPAERRQAVLPIGKPASSPTLFPQPLPD